MLYGTVCFHKNPFLSTTTAPSGVTSILMVKLRNATRNCDSQQYTTHRKNTKCEPKRKQRVCLSISRLTFWRICNSPSFASHTSQVVARENRDMNFTTPPPQSRESKMKFIMRIQRQGCRDFWRRRSENFVRKGFERAKSKERQTCTSRKEQSLVKRVVKM